MKELYITWAETRRLNGMDSYNRPSRFLRELPAEVLEAVRAGSTALQTVRSFQSSSHAATLTEGEALHIGQRVSHRSFGEGVVLQCEGVGERARIRVNFRGSGSKWLILGLANLQPVD